MTVTTKTSTKKHTITKLAKQLKKLLIADNLLITTVESCTGGLLATTLTDLAGSSAYFDRGFVTYSNDSKQTLLGVDENLLSFTP